MIRRLSSQVIREIAAGEVIERPASVLKELIENSIDAGASEIVVEHLEGGTRLLRVSDNGVGIDPADLPLVFENHATSKIEKLEDFESLNSMGFRGEAMSSIAAVSKVNLTSSREIDESAFRVQVQHGQWLGVSAVDKRIGTDVQIEELFLRLPVRQKFLKSAASELRALMQVFKRYALCYPQIAFRFGTADGEIKEILPRTSALNRFLWFFGIEASEAGQIFETMESQGERKIHFIGSKPRYLRPNRQGLQLFLNQRPIRDRSLEFAVRRAFEGFAERTNEVFGCLFLELSPTEFDINVHPAKSEVRFLESDEIFRFVVGGIRRSLQTEHKELRANLDLSEGVEPTLSLQAQPVVSNSGSEPISQSFFNSPSATSASSERPKFGVLKDSEIFESPSDAKIGFGFTTSFQLLGVVEKTFLIAKKSEELYLFDQHALHERVLYEELRREVEKKDRINSQRLLFPVNLDFERALELLEQESLLESLGFEVREWQSGKVQLVAVPGILKGRFSEALQAILECAVSAKDSILREALARVACHSAIRSHDFISNQEAQKILDQFESDDALGHCPHGRPTFIRLARRDLEKFFHR